MAKRKFTDEQIQEAIERSSNFSNAARLLGASPETVRKRARNMGIHSPLHHRKKTYSEKDLAVAVAASASFRATLYALNLVDGGSRQTRLKEEVLALGLDISHFTGAGHSKGKRSPRRLSKEEILVLLPEGSLRRRRVHLHRAMLESGLLETCRECSINEWQNKPLLLHIDHVNGNPLDNRIENLRFLCPNCHSQTPTWGNKLRR